MISIFWLCDLDKEVKVTLIINSNTSASVGLLHVSHNCVEAVKV